MIETSPLSLHRVADIIDMESIRVPHGIGRHSVNPAVVRCVLLFIHRHERRRLLLQEIADWMGVSKRSVSEAVGVLRELEVISTRRTHWNHGLAFTINAARLAELRASTNRTITRPEPRA